MSIETGCGIERLRLAGKLDERKAARLSRVTVDGEKDFDDGSGHGEQFVQVFLRGLSIEVPYVQFGGDGGSPSGLGLHYGGNMPGPEVSRGNCLLQTSIRQSGGACKC